MGKFLDAQTSQNASYRDSISIPVTTTPALFGSLGLNTTGAGPNIRVEFTFTATLSSLAAILTPVNIEIYRGTGVGRVLVYSAQLTLPVAGLGVASETIITLAGADFNPPSPNNFLVYQSFISIPGGIVIAPTRTGPESFFAAAFSN
ncbi:MULTISPECIES: hypothetical protein [Bacillaceae]|uniref:hypothetical protein n=1 Tax=Bacillaceae TaxID=186817 RepID=UPI000C333FF2|nr:MULTISPECIES: hypothetical protein [Bacillaceae]MCT4477980.1 hypothetical protein [Peribacillus frigoritolerans]PKF86536.1 hypothetical protein CW306_20480 [Bacillus sp. BA3]CAH0131906.1 hypothetical protein SRABI134_00306 [Peribacillus sp. Bi134]